MQQTQIWGPLWSAIGRRFFLSHYQERLVFIVHGAMFSQQVPLSIRHIGPVSHQDDDLWVPQTFFRGAFLILDGSFHYIFPLGVRSISIAF